MDFAIYENESLVNFSQLESQGLGLNGIHFCDIPKDRFYSIIKCCIG